MFVVFTLGLGLSLPKGPFGRLVLMETFNALLAGFAVALTLRT